MKFSKKVIGIIVSILILLAGIFCIDIWFFNKTVQERMFVLNAKKSYLNDKVYIPNYFIKLLPIKTYYEYEKKFTRPVMNKDSKEREIVIFGCSFAHGYIFDNKETISYVMSKYSKRPIYNRAYNSFAMQHAIYQLLNDEEMVKSIKNPKYVYYVLMDYEGHFLRMFFTNFPSVLDNRYFFTYKNKNGKLVENKPFLNMYYNFSIFRHIQNKLIEENIHKKFLSGDKELFDNFILHFTTLNNLIKEKWSKEGEEPPKLVILTFEYTKKELWAKQLEKEGIDVVDIAEVIGKESLKDKDKGYFEPEASPHPNGKLWNEFIPKLKEIYPDL